MGRHRQLVHPFEGRRARSRVAAGLQRRHQVQPAGRGSGRAELARPELRPAEPDAAVPGDCTTSTVDDPACGATRSATPTATASATAWSRPRARASNAWWNSFWASDERIGDRALGEEVRLRAERSAGRSRATSPSARSRSSTWPTPTSTATALLDGEDDQDNDDCTNITEVYETVKATIAEDPAWCCTGSAWSRRSARRRTRSTRSTRARRIRTLATCQDYKPFG